MHARHIFRPPFPSPHITCSHDPFVMIFCPPPLIYCQHVISVGAIALTLWSEARPKVFATVYGEGIAPPTTNASLVAALVPLTARDSPCPCKTKHHSSSAAAFKTYTSRRKRANGRLLVGAATPSSLSSHSLTPLTLPT
jgi:hypothetical protein